MGYISKLKEDIDMNIFLVIKNIEYNLLIFYVFLFIIFGKKKKFIKKSDFFCRCITRVKFGLIALKFFVAVDFVHQSRQFFGQKDWSINLRDIWG